MGAAQSSKSAPRTTTIENTHGLFNITDDVVQRLKGQHANSELKHFFTPNLYCFITYNYISWKSYDCISYGVFHYAAVFCEQKKIREFLDWVVP